MTGAYTYEDDSHDQFIEALQSNIPQEWEASEGSAESIIIEYVAEIERRLVALGGSLSRYPEDEDGAPLPQSVPLLAFKIVTLCGSTWFKDEINAVNARLTMQGNLVISLGVFGHVDIPDHDWTTGGNAEKVMLDELHRRKIDLADEIYVVNVGGYIGDSTRGEIQYARAHGKIVSYLVEPE
jgi:hypothetical protein